MRRALVPTFLRTSRLAAACAASFVVFAASGRAGDWYVDVQALDCVNADGSAAAPFCTIGAAVAVASSGDTIHIAPGSYFELVTLDRSLQLVGTGGAAATTIDGSSLGTVVAVAGGVTAELEELTITHGKARRGGGVSVDVGGGLTVTDCVFVSNQAEAVDGLGVRVASNGGAIFGDHATMVVATSTFTDNFASGGGGAIRSEFGALTVTDSNFLRDVAGDAGDLGGGGGAIDGYGDGVLIVQRSSFDSDRADSPDGYGGGAIYSSTGNFTADHLLVHAGVAASYAGGIGSQYAMTLSESTVEACVAAWGGGVYATGANVVTRCVIRGNLATGMDPWAGGGGGYCGSGVFTSCRIEGNTVDAISVGSGEGGGLFLDASSSVESCVVSGNVATASAAGGIGGGIAIDGGGSFNLISTAIFDNVATAAAAGTAGLGGGVAIRGVGPFLPSVAFGNDTLGGNSAEGLDGLPLGDGGGLWIDPAIRAPGFSDTIVAGNTAVSTGAAPDVSGTIFSYGYNLIGDTTGCTITGSRSGDLLDVDPRYADPQHGDFSLAIDSPAIDAGPSQPIVMGLDAAGHPRMLDATLDRVMLIDLGAYEFDNVNLAVTGSSAPGGTLTFTTSGTAGLPILLCVGSPGGDTWIPPFGELFLDLASPWLVLPWGTVPDQRSFTVDPALPRPAHFVLQEFVFDSALRAGNFGNVVDVELE